MHCDTGSKILLRHCRVMGRSAHLSKPKVTRGHCGTLRRMAATGQGRTSVRVNVAGTGATNVETGLSVLDHLVELLAAYASFDIALAVQPTSADAELAAAGRALGEAMADPLRADGARGHGSGIVPADEALANVAIEVSDRSVVYSNVDLSEARVAGLATDLAARFLEQFARGAGLTMHVRLVEGSDTQHVLEAIFKALGVALAQASQPRERRAS
jgi:imidazoleglycerol-phosphate dehydratase